MRFSRLTFVQNNISNSRKFMRAWFLGKDRLCSISKFGSIKNPLISLYMQKIYSVVQKKEVITMSHGSSTSCWKAAENHGHEWRLAWYLWWGYMHQVQPETIHKINCQQKKSKFKDIFPWNISQMITKTILIITRIVIRWKEESTFGLKESQLKLIHDQNF